MPEEVKFCKTCGTWKGLSEFYKDKRHLFGVSYKCKEYTKEYNRERHKRDDVKQAKKEYEKNKRENDFEHQLRVKKRSQEFYSSNHGRAKTLFKSAKRRESNFNENIDFDYTFILEKIDNGFCEATGVEFDLDKNDKYVKNPYSPSIDRIDPNVGYTKDNVRIVIWQFNLMKGELEDNDLLSLCKKFIKFNEENHGSN